MLRRSQYVRARAFSVGSLIPFVTSRTTALTSGVHFHDSSRSLCFQRPISSHEAKVAQATATRSSSFDGGFSSCGGRGTFVDLHWYVTCSPLRWTVGSSLPLTLAYLKV